jgi:hypothetical protein
LQHVLWYGCHVLLYIAICSCHIVTPLKGIYMYYPLNTLTTVSLRDMQGPSLHMISFWVEVDDWQTSWCYRDFYSLVWCQRFSSCMAFTLI